jgi:hypothetical protein
VGGRLTAPPPYCDEALPLHEPSGDDGDCLNNCQNCGDCQNKRQYRESDVQPEHLAQVNFIFRACLFNCNAKAPHRFDLRMWALLSGGSEPVVC